LAYIYRYQLKNAELRKRTSLIEYKNGIQLVLEKEFSEKLKDSNIEEKYFEFQLYESVTLETLREMGKNLKSELPIDDSKYGFIRMRQELYALIHFTEESLDNMVHIELIDAWLVEKYELFVQRANSFFEKTNKSEISIEKRYIREQIVKNYYLDVLDVYVDKRLLPPSLREASEESCFLIKGNHRHIKHKVYLSENSNESNLLFLEKCFDIRYMERQRGIERLEDNQEAYIDCLEIHSYKEYSSEVIEHIEDKLKLDLPITEQFNIFSQNKENIIEERKKYVFRVHNVGQALATSLTYEGDQYPFLYFDYGMPYGKNLFTKPTSVNMPTKPNSMIVLSHMDKDHWFRIADDINAYQCNWFVPDQKVKLQLRNKFAGIVLHGGTVSIINQDCTFKGARITCGGMSKIDPQRLGKCVHETGLTLRFQTYDSESRERNILIAGDQQYDYIDDLQLRDLDILVASHHGGEFCWSGRGDIPRARTSETSKLIYSCGKKNTYSHPSKVGEYAAADWRESHYTWKEGDYEIQIYL